MRATLFIPCLTEQFFPETGLSMARVLKHLGIQVDYVQNQTCCGQPAYNAGHRPEAARLAARFLDLFGDAEVVVAPSGSCVSMVRNHYDDLELTASQQKVHAALKNRIFEFTEFLTENLGITDIGGRYASRVTYHPSCHLLRELHIDTGPRRLLAAVKGLTLLEMEDAEQCCGFGGTFSVKFPELSTAMVRDKCRTIEATGAEFVVGADTSCLMHIGGWLSRNQSPVKPLHIADLLAASL